MIPRTKFGFILIFLISVNGFGQENTSPAFSLSSGENLSLDNGSPRVIKGGNFKAEKPALDDARASDSTSVSEISNRKIQNSNVAKQRGGLVVSAFVGAAKTAPTDLTISQPALNTDITFENVRLASRSFDPPLYYGFRAGYFFPQLPFLGVEAEFIHLKVYSNPQQRVRATGVRRGTPVNGEIRLGDIVQQYSISHGANFLLLNAAARRGFFPADADRNRLILTARAGLGPTIPHTESNIEGRQQEQYETGRLGWQLAGGAEFKLFRGLYALGEYKYTQTRQRGKIFSGTARSFLRTHHGVFGLSYHF